MKNITYKMHRPENGFQSNFTQLLPPGYGIELDDISLAWAFAKAANCFGMPFFSLEVMIRQLKKDINENHHR
jgi:hypothetical protein